MVPTPADIARYRHVAAAAVRGVGLLLLVYSAPRLGVYAWDNAERLVRQWNSASQFRGSSVTMLIKGVTLHAVLLGSAIFAVGWPRVLARWLVPARVRAACPGCGFDLDGLRSETCPECGLLLGAEFLPGDSKAGGADSE